MSGVFRRFFEKVILGVHPSGDRPREKGNVFFTLFGAVAVVGVLGAGIMATMRGPLSTMVEVNRIEETKAEMGISLRLILLAGSERDGGAGDVLTEPPEPASCSSATGAGCIPSGVSAKQKDAWGTLYAYCAWNNGSDHAAIGSNTHAGGSSTNNIAVALISAGPDRHFDTTCSDAPGFVPVDGIGDDIVKRYNYNDAVAGSDGVWTVEDDGTGDDKATTAEELNVQGTGTSTFTGGATFGSNVQTTGAVQTDVINPNPDGSQDYIDFGGSVKLPNSGSVTCAAGTEGAIAYDPADKVVAYCDGTGSWLPVGKKLWTEDASGMHNDASLAAHVGIGGNSGSDMLTVAGSTQLSGSVTVGSVSSPYSTDLYGTLGVSGTSDFNDKVTIDGTGDVLAVNSDVFVVQSDGKIGIGTAAPDDELDVVGYVDVSQSYQIGNANILSDNGDAGGSILLGDVTAPGSATDYLNIGDLLHGDLASKHVVVGEADTFDVSSLSKTLTVKGDADVSATITAGTDITSTSGDIIASAGAVDAHTTVTAGTGVTATTGDIVALSGNVDASGDVDAGGKVTFANGSKDLTPQLCDVATKKTYWDGNSWECVDDLGAGTGTGGALTLAEVLTNGDDAGNKDASNFNQIGADYYCPASFSSYADCVDASTMISGSVIWKKNGIDPTKIYYNDGNVGIGTNLPGSKLEVAEGKIMVSTEGTDPSITSSIRFLSKKATPGSDFAAAGNIGWMMGARSDGYSPASEQNDFLLQYWNGVTWGPSVFYADSVTGNVRIGWGGYQPLTRLDVSGTVRLGDSGEACTDTDSDNHTGAIRYVAADDEYEVCADEAKGWESLFKSGDKGGLWAADDGGGKFIEYDDATLGGMRVGSVAGAPMREGWVFDADNFLLFTNGKAGANQYCAPDGTHCFDPGVLSAINDGQGIWMKDGPGGGSGEIYYAGGNVGIGTSNPETALHVKANGPSVDLEGTDHTYIRFYPEGVSAGRKGFFGFPDNKSTAPYLELENERDGSPHDLVLHDTGKIGVGTNTPATKLDVAGTLKIGDGAELCNAVDHEGSMKYDAADDKFYVCRNAATGWEVLLAQTGGGGAESDPEVGTLTGSKWCAANAGGTAIDCTLDAPSGGDNLGNHIATTTVRSDTNNTDDLGTSAIKWKDGWFAGTVAAGTFSGSGASLTSLPAGNLTGTLPALSGENLTNLNASNLASGIVATARMGTGTADSSTFLRGDGTWTAVSGGGSTFSCPSGFTKVEKLGEVLGCIKNTTEGSGTCSAAIANCWSSYGGRLPTYPEAYIATIDGIFSVSATNGEWTGEAHYDNGNNTYACGKIKSSADNHKPSGDTYTVSTAYRCFIPVGANGVSGTEVDPKIGALSASKWCAANASGSGIDCDQNTPGGDNLGDHIATTDLNMSGKNITNVLDITLSGVIRDTSDRRRKTHIERLDEGGSLLEKIRQIKTYRFHMKDNPEGPLEFGVMAQELEKVFPNLVFTADDAMGTKSVNYMGLIAPLIEAVKELDAQNTALREENGALDDRLADVEGQVALLSKIAGDGTQKSSSVLLWWCLMAFVAGAGAVVVINRGRKTG